MVRSNQYCSPRPVLFLLDLVCAFMLLSCMAPHPVFAQTEEEQSRACWGFLYCKETKGDTTWTEGFFWLYSTEERGTFSRMTVIPFYSTETDPAERYTRRSILWPLSISERRGDTSYFQVLPFYWHAHEPQQEYRIVAPLFFDYATGDSRYTHYLPLFGRHQHGSLYHRYYLLGPLAIATYDKETDLKEWDILFPLFHYGTDRKGYEARLFPLYWAGGSYDDGDWYRHVFPLYWSSGNETNGNWYRHILPLHGRSVTPQSDLSYLFPLYGSVTDAESHETRTSLVGLPPFPRTSLPALALYEHASSPASVSDRFFPLYRYSYAEPEQRRELNVLALYQMQDSPALTFHRLFPLYSYEDDREKNRGGWSFLGYDRFSLTGHGHDSAQQWHHVVPLYRTSQDVTAHTRTTDVLGLGPLSFFRHSQTPEGSFHRFFPLYSYEHPSEDEWHWSALVATPLALYRHDEKGTAVHDRFLPLYDWDRDGDRREFSMLGVSWFSLFHRESAPTNITHRLFPLYSYEHPSEDEWHWSALVATPLALYRHDEKGTAVHDRFLPLYDWDRDGDRREFSMLGVSWFSLFHRESAPTNITHRLFPLYRYRHDLASDEADTDTLLLHRHHFTKTQGTDRFFLLWDSTWQREQPIWELDFLGIKPVTLFHHATSPTDTTDRLFPLYGYERTAADEQRLSLLGFPPREKEFSWSLYDQSTSSAHFRTRFFPLYRYERNDETKEVNWSALLLYRHAESESHLVDTFPPFHEYERDGAKGTAEFSLIGLKPVTLFKQGSAPDAANSMLFPLYDYDRHGDSNRLSLLGWPKVGTFPTLSLFERVATPSETTHRFFPLYRYNRNDEAKTLNWDALLWWHRETEFWTQDVLYPFLDIEHDRQKDLHEVGALGMRPFTFFQYHSTPEESWQYAALLYAYSAEGAHRRFSALGLPHYGQFPALSLFAMERTSATYAQRLFPLYAYAQDDQTGTLDWQALLLWWHRQTATHVRNFFLPLTDYERDEDPDRSRLSLVGLPKIGTLPALTLFNSERTATARTHRLLPLYWYARDNQADTFDWQALLLWWHRQTATHVRDFFLPLTDYERDEDPDRSRLSLVGLPKIGTLPALTLFNSERTATARTHRLLPLYWYARDNQADTFDWQALLLWWHRQTATHVRDFFLPLTDYERDEDPDRSRLSLVGLPKIGTLPALTLFNSERTATARTHRLLPLYWYARDDQAGTLDWQALLLWWHQTDQMQTKNIVFPLGSLRQGSNGQDWNFSALGIEPVSLIEVDHTKTETRNRFSPLWDYGQAGPDRRLSLLGIRQLALFSHEHTANGMTEHFFPLWWRAEAPTEAMNLLIPLWSEFTNHQTHEQARGILGLGPLSLYYQERTPSGMSARLFPLWSYQYDEATQEHRTSALGVYPIALYSGSSSPTAIENRLFPFFRYTSDLVKNESEFWFLWPLYDQKTAEGRTTEASFLWWLFDYRSPRADEWEYWVLGHPPMAMFIRTVSPTTTHVEINPIIPLWRRDSVEGVGTSWAVLGGLIGMDAMPDGTHKLRLLWMSKRD